MSTQPYKFIKQVDEAERRVQAVTDANVEMLGLMYEALHEIARSEVSLDGGIAIKRIAEETLLGIHLIVRSISLPVLPSRAAGREEMERSCNHVPFN